MTATSTKQMEEIAQPVKRCETYEEFYKEITDNNPRPVIFKIEKEYELPNNTFDADYFKSKFGNNIVGYHESDTKEFFLSTVHSIKKLASMRMTYCTTFSKFIDMIMVKPKANDKYYTINGTHMNIHKANKGVLEEWAELFEDSKKLFMRYVPTPARPSMDLEQTFDEKKSPLDLDVLQDVGIWVSAGRNQQFTLHWDTNGHHNINYQLKGNKKFLLFSPLDTQNLYPLPGPLWQTSRIPYPYDVTNSTKDFPLYKNSKPYYCETGPNEILFIPAKWWHHVTHSSEHEFTVNLTAWFKSPHSAKKFPYLSFIVPEPIHAYWILMKGVIAFCFLFLFVLLSYEEGQQIADTEKRLLNLLEPIPTLIARVKRVYLKAENHPGGKKNI